MSPSPPPPFLYLSAPNSSFTYPTTPSPKFNTPQSLKPPSPFPLPNSISTSPQPGLPPPYLEEDPIIANTTTLTTTTALANSTASTPSYPTPLPASSSTDAADDDGLPAYNLYDVERGSWFERLLAGYAQSIGQGSGDDGVVREQYTQPPRRVSEERGRYAVIDILNAGIDLDVLEGDEEEGFDFGGMPEAELGMVERGLWREGIRGGDVERWGMGMRVLVLMLFAIGWIGMWVGAIGWVIAGGWEKLQTGQ